MLKKLWSCFLALFCLALAAAVAEERVGDVGTWMLVGRDRFWSTASQMLVLKSDGSIAARDGDEDMQLSWVAGEDGSISKVECATRDYSAKVQEDFIVISRVWNGLETERAVYRYMFDASGARVPDPEYGDSGFAGVWEGGNMTLTLAPNGNGQLRAYYFSDDIDYDDVWWHPLSDGSGIRLLRVRTGAFSDLPLENGVLRLYETGYNQSVERTDKAVDAEQFQNYPSLSAAPTPAPTSTPAPQIYSDGTFEYRALEDGVEIVSYLENRPAVTVPEEIEGKPVVRIGSYAFSRADMLTNVTVPGCVKEIASYAFFECPGLSKVSIQSGTEVIDEYAFYGCSNLGLVNVPESVNSIGRSAFLQDPKHDDTYIVVERGSNAERCAEAEGIPYSILPPDADDVPEELDLQPGNVARFAGTEWLVLLREGGRAMLLRWEALPRQAFHSDERGTRWRDSDLRAWLNGEYLDRFDERERAIIENSLTITKPNRDSDIAISDPPTMDRAFLLDYYEVEELMPDEASRAAFFEDGSGVDWWLRTDGAMMDHQMVVNEDGSLSAYYDSTLAGVRPAICVDLTRAEGLVEFAAESAGAMYEQVFGTALERLSGVWICQSGGEEGNRASTLTLNADGTGSYVRADMLAAPGEIYDAYDFQWAFDAETVVLARDGEREMLEIGEDSLWMPSTAEYLHKSPQYEALLQSAQSCDWTTLEALLGAWEVRGAEIEGDRYALKLTLKPDAGAVLYAGLTELEGGEVVNRHEMEESGCWSITPGGVRFTSQDGSLDEEILFNGDGTITADGCVLPVVQAATLGDWEADAQSYAYREYQDYTGSPFVGAWRSQWIVDEYSGFSSELLLRLEKDSTGAFEDAFSGRTVSIDWSPEDAGIHFRLDRGEEQFPELGLFPDMSGEMRWEEDGLSWISDGPAGYLYFEKVADDYRLSRSENGLIPLPTLPPTPEPDSTPEPAQEFVGDDSEEALREYLSAKSGIAEFARFFYGDYDGDGSCEAFAFAGADSVDGYTGELWFVGASGARQLMEDASFLSLDAQDCGAFQIFSAEEWYGGSGSRSHVWYVHGSEPKELAIDSLGDFSYDGGNEFSSYSDAFDLFSDGTGHSWKRYYYYFDLYREELHEYGGMEISQEQLLAWPGAREILEDAESRGWRIGEIYYRGNGVINVNLYEQNGGAISQNDNLTLDIQDGKVVNTDESYAYGGTYAWANTPEIASAPSEFPQPDVPAEPVDLAPEPEAAPEAQAPGGMDVFEFENLSPEFVQDSEMYDDGECQNYIVYLCPDVCADGSEGYLENWVTEEGVLSDAALDLDGDGQDEYLIYETRNAAGSEGMDFRTAGSLAVFESRDGEWVEADRIESLASLMPQGVSSICTVQSDSGILLADAIHGRRSDTAYCLNMNLLRYDGERFRYALCARIDSETYSWFASEPLPDAELSAIDAAIGNYLQGDSSALDALGLSEGQNLTLHVPEAGGSGQASDMAGFEMLSSEIYEKGMEIYFSINGEGCIDDLMVAGGDTFLWVDDGFNIADIGPGETNLMLRTTLDHKPGQIW